MKNKRYSIEFYIGGVTIKLLEKKITAKEIKDLLSSVPDDFVLAGSDTYISSLSFFKDS